MSTGYKSGKCMHAVQGGLPGVIRALQSDINICHPPSLQLPTKKWRPVGPGRRCCLLSKTGLAALGGQYHICPVHNFPHPSELLVCYQPDRQKVVPGQTSMYETFLVVCVGWGEACGWYGVGICVCVCVYPITPSQISLDPVFANFAPSTRKIGI
jgi:hypothetical protein